MTIKAIRLYEERGLIKPRRGDGRYRIYTEANVDLLLLIKETKQLGVSLSQLHGLITTRDEQLDWHSVERFLVQKKQQIHGEIANLNQLIDHIDGCLAQIQQSPKLL